LSCSRAVRGRLCLLQKSSSASDVSLEMCLERESSPEYIPFFWINSMVFILSTFLTLISTVRTLAAAKADSTSCGSGYMLLSPTWIEPTRYSVDVDETAFHMRKRRGLGWGCAAA